MLGGEFETDWHTTRCTTHIIGKRLEVRRGSQIGEGGRADGRSSDRNATNGGDGLRDLVARKVTRGDDLIELTTGTWLVGVDTP